MDVGLTLLRIVLAAVLFAHATQKVFGWFSGPGLVGATEIFEKLGQRPARAMVLVAAACESSSAVLLALGLLTPLAAAIAAGTMTVAGASMKRLSGSFWNAAGGGEYPFVLAAAAAVLGFTGAGAWSMDAALNAPWHDLTTSQATAMGVGVTLLAAAAALPPTRSSTRAVNPPTRAH